MPEPVSGRCRDCRWWDGMPEKFPEQFGDCKKSEQPGSLMLGAESDISGERTIMTSPDFGCVMFEARDA